MQKIDYEPSWQEGQPLLEMIEKRERLAIDYLLIIWTCHFAETYVDGLFCYIQQAYFDDKKNQIIEQKEPVRHTETLHNHLIKWY